MYLTNFMNPTYFQIRFTIFPRLNSIQMMMRIVSQFALGPKKVLLLQLIMCQILNFVTGPESFQNQETEVKSYFAWANFRKDDNLDNTYWMQLGDLDVKYIHFRSPSSLETRYYQCLKRTRRILGEIYQPAQHCSPICLKCLG